MLSYYRNQNECVCVETGMPEQMVRVGTGETPREVTDADMDDRMNAWEG